MARKAELCLHWIKWAHYSHPNFTTNLNLTLWTEDICPEARLLFPSYYLLTGSMATELQPSQAERNIKSSLRWRGLQLSCDHLQNYTGSSLSNFWLEREHPCCRLCPAYWLRKPLHFLCCMGIKRMYSSSLITWANLICAIPYIQHFWKCTEYMHKIVLPKNLNYYLTQNTCK